MRILHTADWHLGKSLENISRLAEQKRFLDWLCQTVHQEEVDLVLVAGDVFDTYNPSAAAERLFYDSLERLNDSGRRAVVVIAGNHDNPERLAAAAPLAGPKGIFLLGYPQSRTDLHPPESPYLRLIEGGEGWMELEWPEKRERAVLLTLPYPSEARLDSLVSQRADETLLAQAYHERVASLLQEGARHFRKETINLVVSHLLLLGGRVSDSERSLQVGGAMLVGPEAMPESADYVALGHLHRPQKMRSAPGPVYYAGAPLAYSFSESGYAKAVYLVEVRPDQAENRTDIRPLYIEGTQPLVRWQAKEGYGQALAWCESGLDAQAWVDLEIWTDRTLTVEEQRALRSSHPGLVHIRPRFTQDQEEAPLYEDKTQQRIDLLFESFYMSRTGAQPPEDLMRVFLQTVQETVEGGCDDETLEPGN